MPCGRRLRAWRRIEGPIDIRRPFPMLMQRRTRRSRRSLADVDPSLALSAISPLRMTRTHWPQIRGASGPDINLIANRLAFNPLICRAAPATARESPARPQPQAPVPCAANRGSSRSPRWPRPRQRYRERSCKFLDTFAEIVCAKPVEQCPGHRTRAVGKHEVGERHSVCSRNEPDDRSQHSHKASNEDNHATGVIGA